MEQRGRRRHIPAFGEWNQQCEELPITQYFESAMQAGLVRAGHYYHDAAGEAVLFRSSVSPPPHKPAKKVRSTMENQAGSRRQQGALVAGGGSHKPRRSRVVRAVDEDLYQVPSDLLRKKGKGRKHVRSLWMGCVGLNCVA
ncbi:hypothetical protein EJB05_01981 [Eragrostis curvula]|uniref:RIN4 pathogenic type III effector avirulence factor Avr cleavage site domain-containing protein n=1 Tax=Eragrostis curvula TaxID=38414 RepID=A0A5J9WR29_9POAL|nr:hypothetical protein EJB05_01981 [Eragrostis curvula]